MYFYFLLYFIETLFICVKYNTDKYGYLSQLTIVVAWGGALECGSDDQGLSPARGLLLESFRTPPSKVSNSSAGSLISL